MNLEKLNNLIKFMNKNNLSELEVEEEGQKIRLKKEQGQISNLLYEPAPNPKKSDTKNNAQPDKKLKEIKSPMVGTFYRSPSPDSKPYVEIGETVQKDKVICIVEAMKVMNEVKAEIEGQIDQILVENGQPVEFGQPLFAIK